jgi:hypothetical protein
MLGDMTIRRMDNVLIVVDNLETAKAFFTELGMALEDDVARHHDDLPQDERRHVPATVKGRSSPRRLASVRHCSMAAGSRGGHQGGEMASRKTPRRRSRIARRKASPR